MSIRDELNGMLYSGSNVNFQNAAIYKEGEATPQKTADFMKLWKDSKTDIVEHLLRKLPLGFDYVVYPDNSMLVYLKPEGDDTTPKQKKPNEILDFKPEGQISITPIIDKEKGIVSNVSVQAKYNVNGEDYNKRTLDIVAFKLPMPDLIDQITAHAVTLSRNLSIIQ